MENFLVPILHPSPSKVMLESNEPNISQASCSSATTPPPSPSSRLNSIAFPAPSQFLFDKLPIYSSDLVPLPLRTKVIDPATHMPMSLIKITRDENGDLMAKFPPNWRNLGYVVYLWIDAKGKQLVGSSGNFERRFSAYLSAFRGKGSAKHLSLSQAFRKGIEVCVGIAMVCSSKASMKQNETSLIVQKKLAGYALHNVVNGEGDPNILLGSPTADGRGGEIPKKLMRSPIAIDREQPKITDTTKWTPKRYFPVTLNDEGEITITLPEGWRDLASVIYVFKVKGEDGVERRLVGETGRPIWKRVSEYKGAFNGKGACANLPLPLAVREAVLDERKVKFSILGVCSPDVKVRKQFEAHFIVTKNSTITEEGFNQRMEASPSHPGRALYQPPSPYAKRTRADESASSSTTPQKRLRTTRSSGTVISPGDYLRTPEQRPKRKFTPKQLNFNGPILKDRSAGAELMPGGSASAELASSSDLQLFSPPPGQSIFDF